MTLAGVEMANGSLDLSDIQGFILRGYRLPLLRCLVLEVDRAGPARQALLSLANEGPSGLRITTAEEWCTEKPLYCLNVGMTWPGLLALGLGSLPRLSFDSFPSFVAGAAARALALGDTGGSAPEHWISPLGSGRDHAILALYAADGAQLAEHTARLQAVLAGAWHVRAQLDGAALPEGRVHFGYRDGISQPTIIGGPERSLPDGQPPVPAWNFILSATPEANYYLPQPERLGKNGSFGVFRVLRQNVFAFERFLESQRAQIDPELLAAKLCGRWRNGVPLSLSPDSDVTALPESAWNDFDYVPSGTNPRAPDDRRGERCPIGAHIRRSFPRGMRVQGGGNHLHRMIRRGVPYGPEYRRGQPEDDIERGLLGFFINASIENQYEFVLATWCNAGGFAAGLPIDSKDGVASADESVRFDIARANGQPPLAVGGFSRFVQARGGAYCFLPSIDALRFIGELPD
jgi:Dyp-type peroxidase family